MDDDIAVRSETQEPFGLEPGARIKRTLLHEQFGGSGQGGMNPSGKSQNIFLFSDPETGLQVAHQDLVTSRFTGSPEDFAEHQKEWGADALTKILRALNFPATREVTKAAVMQIQNRIA